MCDGQNILTPSRIPKPDSKTCHRLKKVDSNSKCSSQPFCCCPNSDKFLKIVNLLVTKTEDERKRKKIKRMSESRAFLFQAVVIWVVLCLPGNLVTLVLHFKIRQEQNKTLPVDQNPDYITKNNWTEMPTEYLLFGRNNDTMAYNLGEAFALQCVCHDVTYESFFQSAFRCPSIKTEIALNQRTKELLCAQLKSGEASVYKDLFQASLNFLSECLTSELESCPPDSVKEPDYANVATCFSSNLEHCLDQFNQVQVVADSFLCEGEACYTNASLECNGDSPQQNGCSNATQSEIHISDLPCHELQVEYDAFLDATKFWLEGVSICVSGFFGLCGNVITFIVLRTTEVNRNFNKLLMALAIVDSLLIVSVIGDTAIIGTFMTSMPLWYKMSYPYFVHPIKGMIQTSTIFMVVAVAAERFKAVCHPLSHRHSPFKFILLVVLISVGLETPRFFQFRLIKNGTDFWTSELMENPVYIQFSSYWDEMITTGAVPLLALVYFNLCMILKIRASGKFSHRFVGSSSSNASVKRSSKTNNMDHSNIETSATTIKTSRNIRRKPDDNHEDGVDTLIQHEDQHEANKRQTRVRILFKKDRSNSLDNQMVEITIGNPPSEEESPVKVVRSSHRSVRFWNRTNSSSGGNQINSNHFQKRREKSTIILVLIVVIFIACHSYRLALKVYEFANPESTTMEHFQHCDRQGRFHVPVVFYVLVNSHHLFLVLNSSINFIIYCCVGREFRSKVAHLFCDRFRNQPYNIPGTPSTRIVSTREC